MRVSRVIAFVDPDMHRGALLRQDLAEVVPSSAYSIRTYKDLDEYRTFLEREHEAAVYAVIADVFADNLLAGEEGAFAKTKRICPRALCILDGMAMRDERELQLRRAGLLDWRKGQNGENLVEYLGNQLRNFEQSAENYVLRAFESIVAACDLPDEESVPLDGGKEMMSPARLLVEMERGTERGKKWLATVAEMYFEEAFAQGPGHVASSSDEPNP